MATIWAYRFRQHFRRKSQLVFVGMHVNVRGRSHVGVPQLNLSQFHASGFLVNDATCRMPENVKPMRPWPAHDFGPIHCGIEHGIAHEIGIARSAVQFAKRAIGFIGVPRPFSMLFQNTKQRLRQMLDQFGIRLRFDGSLQPLRKRPECVLRITLYDVIQTRRSQLPTVNRLLV